MTRRRGLRARRARLLTFGLLALLCTTGTALTADLHSVPTTSVGHLVLSSPSFSAGPPAYDDASGTTTVTFTVTPEAGQVRARAVTAADPAPPYETCSTGDGTTWTCPVPGSTADEAAAGTFAWTATA